MRRFRYEIRNPIKLTKDVIGLVTHESDPVLSNPLRHKNIWIDINQIRSTIIIITPSKDPSQIKGEYLYKLRPKKWKGATELTSHHHHQWKKDGEEWGLASRRRRQYYTSRSSIGKLSFQFSAEVPPFDYRGSIRRRIPI